MYRFLVIIEKADDNYSAYSPDLPGCFATGNHKLCALVLLDWKQPTLTA